jgi:hypothetical protein
MNGVGKRQKGNAQFPNPVTDEYRRVHNGIHASHIFIGDATSPINMCYVTDEYMGPVKVKPDTPYIHRFLAQTDEYNVTFVGFRTDRYNLNIFVSTDEFKKTNG